MLVSWKSMVAVCVLNWYLTKRGFWLLQRGGRGIQDIIGWSVTRGWFHRHSPVWCMKLIMTPLRACQPICANADCTTTTTTRLLTLITTTTTTTSTTTFAPFPCPDYPYPFSPLSASSAMGVFSILPESLQTVELWISRCAVSTSRGSTRCRATSLSLSVTVTSKGWRVWWYRVCVYSWCSRSW